MASSFNKIILLGHMCSDFEMRYTPKGTAIAKANIAVNRNWKTESGEEKQEVTFIPLEAWARTAETLFQYIRKGDPLLIEGRMGQESWEDKETHKQRSKLKVVIETFSFVKSKAPSDRPAPTDRIERPGAAQSAGKPAAPDAQSSEEDSDIPF